MTVPGEPANAHGGELLGLAVRRHDQQSVRRCIPPASLERDAALVFRECAHRLDCDPTTPASKYVFRLNIVPPFRVTSSMTLQIGDFAAGILKRIRNLSEIRHRARD